MGTQTVDEVRRRVQQEIHGTEDARGIRCIGSAPSCGLALSTSLIDGSNELRRAIEADKTTAEARINLSLPVTFADPRSQFNGQAICGQPEMIDEIVLTKTEGGPPGQPHSNESFHPKWLFTVEGVARAGASVPG